MYTQCPDCSVAFRVSADVLKQAAGKVRCGGCGSAFNALEHLSEEKPASAPRRRATDISDPKLTAEVPEVDESGARPKAISAEQSAALLKTLDELAGEDIRIEDTGVEWRVLSEDEEYADDDGPKVIDTRHDTLIEQLEAIADPIADAQTDAPAEEEMRFDDDTPLPDDFDDGNADADSPLQPEATEATEPAKEPVEPQVDLAFGDPDEWEDLLGEVGDTSDDGIEAESAAVDETPEVEDVAEIAAEAATEPEPAAADELPLDMDTQFQLQAEAMGVDLSGLHSTGEDQQDVDDAATEVAAFDPTDTSIDEDLVAAAFEAEAEARKEVSAAEELLEELADATGGEALDIDAQLEELEAYSPQGAVTADVDSAPETEGPEDSAEVDEPELEDSVEADAAELEDSAEVDAAELEDSAEVAELEFEEPDEEEDEAELIDDLHVEQQLPIEAELEEIDSVHTDKTVAAPLTEPEQEDHDVPEMSEEEMTINQMIDQDLLAIAVEDDEGFTSTIVQKQTGSDDDGPDDAADEGDAGDDTADVDSPFKIPSKSPVVETIIMEGETFHGEIDLDKEAKIASFREEAKRNVASQFDSDADDKRSTNVGMIAAAIVLALLLAVQFIHQSRETLATIPAFNSSIGSLYRTIGQPVTPAWNVSGWRFEATKGDIGEGEEVLTIYSRVGNDSDQTLPYPLIHVALTDRFEEIIGSKVLEPAEYLAGDADPRKTVAPGETFNAAIAISTPSPEATGFRLDVCYRMASGQLRCAIEDFK